MDASMKNNGIRRPEVARLADQLQRQNPTWSDQRARSEAKARITAPSGNRPSANGAGDLSSVVTPAPAQGLTNASRDVRVNQAFTKTFRKPT